MDTYVIGVFDMSFFLRVMLILSSVVFCTNAFVVETGFSQVKDVPLPSDGTPREPVGPPNIGKRARSLVVGPTKYEGLKPAVANRIIRETRRSITQVFDTIEKGLVDSFKLDEVDLSQLDSVLMKRAEKRDICLKTEFRKLAMMDEEIPEKAIQNGCNRLSDGI